MIESHLTSPTAHLQSADFTCQLVNAPRNLRNFYKNFCCGMRGRDRQGSQVENFVNSDTLWGDGVDGTFSFVLTATMASWHQRGQREVLGLEILQLADQDLQVPFHCLGQKMESLRAVSRNHGLRGSKSGFSLPTPFFHSCHHQVILSCAQRLYLPQPPDTMDISPHPQVYQALEAAPAVRAPACPHPVWCR